MGQGSDFNQNWKANQQHGIINLVFTAIWCHHCHDTETYNKDWWYCCGARVDSTWTSGKDRTWQNWEVCLVLYPSSIPRGVFPSRGHPKPWEPLPSCPSRFLESLLRSLPELLQSLNQAGSLLPSPLSFSVPCLQQFLTHGKMMTDRPILACSWLKVI